MNIKEYAEELTKELQDDFGEDYIVATYQITKYNNTPRDIISIGKKTEEILSSYYVDNYYPMPISVAVNSIYIDYHEDMETRRQMENYFDDLSDMDKWKDKICYKLVNGEENDLSDRPYFDIVGDLKGIFYIAMEMDEGGMITCQITNSVAEAWGLNAGDTVKELYYHAKKNTPRILPVEKVRNVADFLDFNPGMEIASPLWVLTNENRLYGASCMIYQGVLHEQYKRFGSFSIIPSSTDEVLIVPDKYLQEMPDIAQLVYEVNRSGNVSHDKFLSDQIFRFDEDGLKQKNVQRELVR